MIFSLLSFVPSFSLADESLPTVELFLLSPPLGAVDFFPADDLLRRSPPLLEDDDDDDDELLLLELDELEDELRDVLLSDELKYESK